MKRLMNRYIAALLLIAISVVACKNNREPREEPANADTATAPVQPVQTFSYSIVNEYPHDPAAFTEGLQYLDGFLYESTGRYGYSDIRKTDLKSGKVLQQQKMDNRYFGEGMTILNGKIYQLTYREKTGFVYDLKTLKQLQTFQFGGAEGWGMTNDGTNLIYDDGGSVLIYMDPSTFKEVKRVNVTDGYGPVDDINELEFIKGYIYANQWQTDLILKIDPAAGKVLAQANLGDLRAKAGIPQPTGADESAPDVLNGIAYDAQNNRIFITGKNWPKLFEVKLDN